MKCKLISLRDLKQHEKISQDHLFSIRDDIISDGFIRNPIIVDRDSGVILDGHHRYNAALEMGLKRIPTVLVDYLSSEIKVYPRRKNIKVTKEIIIQIGENGKLFPYKTTRHVIPRRPLNVKTPLKELV